MGKIVLFIASLLIATSAPGMAREGKCVGDCQNGIGTLYERDGYKYIGTFRHGEFNGQGTYYRPDGGKFYEGQWENGKYEGIGTEYAPDGTVTYKGQWKADEPVHSESGHAPEAEAVAPPASKDIKHLTADAKKGDADAQFELYTRYSLGIGGAKKDERESLGWLRKAAEANNPNAQFQLGLLYYAGLAGFVADDAEAAKWLKISADQGHPAACIFIGLFYSDGSGVEKDLAAAYEYLSKVEPSTNLNGVTPARVSMVGDFFYDQKDFVKAHSWYLLAASRGNARAQFRAAYMYDAGEGVEPNVKSAHEWYLKAASQNIAAAQYNLGLIYKNGYEGLPASPRAAIDSFYKAALTYLKQEDIEGALRAVDAIENTIPDHTLARKILKKIYGDDYNEHETKSVKKSNKK